MATTAPTKPLPVEDTQDTPQVPPSANVPVPDFSDQPYADSAAAATRAPLSPAQPSPLPAPAQPQPTPAPTADDQKAYEKAGAVSVDTAPADLKAKADAFKKQQQLGQGAGAQPGTDQPKELIGAWNPIYAPAQQRDPEEEAYQKAGAVPVKVPEPKKEEEDTPEAYKKAGAVDVPTTHVVVPTPTPQGPTTTEKPVATPQPQVTPNVSPPGTFTNPATGNIQPLQTQAPLLTPVPTPQGPTGGTPQGPIDPQDQIAALVAQGLSPGAAQAIINGQKPVTISGALPKPPALPQPSPQPQPQASPQPQPQPSPQPAQPPAQPKPQTQQSQPAQDQPESMEDAQKRYEAERAKLPQQQPAPAQKQSPQTEEQAYQSLSDGDKALYDSVRGKVAGAPAGSTPKLTPAEQAVLDRMKAQTAGTTAPSGSTTDEPKTIVGGGMLKGTATSFGLNYDGSYDKDDNGIGFFGAVNTRNPKLKAVAVPVDVLEAAFGKFTQKNAAGGYDALDTPEAKKVIAAIRSAHVEALGLDGKIHNFPIVDIQGSLGGHPGKVLDMTPAAGRELGFNDNHSVSYQIAGGDGKPYAIPADQLAGWNSGEGSDKGGRGHKDSGNPFQGQPLFSVGEAGGGGTRSPQQSPMPRADSGGGYHPAAPDQSGGGGSFVWGWPSGGGGGGGGGEVAASAMPVNVRGSSGGQPPLDEMGSLQPPQPPQDPMVAALMKRGFTQAQAQQYAQGVQNIAPGKGIGPLQGGAPPPAPSGVTLNLSGKQPIEAKLLSAKQLMPSFKAGKTGAIGKGPPPPPAAPSAVPTSTMRPAPASGQAPPPAAPSAPPGKAPLSQPAADPSIVAGLMKRGFTRAQAEAYAARATVTAPGASAIAGSTSFRNLPPAAPSAPGPAKTSATPRTPTPSQPAASSTEPTPFSGRPAGSTHGDPNPEGMEDAIAGLKLPAAAKAHASLLSPDDPRVKRQADGYIKGEHFVEGDPFHDQLLGGLPYGKQGRQRGILSQAETAIADKSPMHISYISAPKEAEKFPTRESRRVQYDEHSPEARLMGTTEGQLVGHSLLPVSVGITPSKKAGEPHQGVIHGISTNVLANNFQHINDKLAELGQKTPYPQLGTKFSNDLEGYLSNLNAGHTGTGRGYAVGTIDHPNTPDTSHVPYKLTRREADFINAAINNTAAFAKHGDAEKLRNLARANGTLITPEGETNRMRYQMEEHEPGWRQKVLEPTIRSFKAGLIHEFHPSEAHMPESIRPGKAYQDLTRAIARTSERGRPDVPIATSPRSAPTAAIPRDLAQNRLINEVERDFSEDKINEAEARRQLRAIGENPDEYQFHGGSGGLISPYEPDPMAITHAEHLQLKDSLRKKWLSGSMNVEDYKRKTAEVPLPSLPSKPSTPINPVAEAPKPPKIAIQPEGVGDLGVSGTSTPKPIAPPKPKPVAPPKPEEPEAPEEKPETPPAAPSAPPAPKPQPKAKVSSAEATTPELAQPSARAPASDEPLPARKPAPATPTFASVEQLPAKPAKATKGKEQTDLEAEDLKQAAADRDDISPEDAARLAKVQKTAKGWIKKNPEIHPLSAHSYLTGDQQFPGKFTKEGIGEHFDATNPRLDYNNPEHRTQASQALVHDIMHALAGTTTGKPSTAYGWYDRTVRKTMNKVGEVAPKVLTDKDHAMAFKLGLAITSQGQDVFPNAENAWHIYQHWLKHGELPTDRKVFGGGIKAEQMEQNLAKVNDLWKQHGTEGLHKILSTPMTVGELKKEYGLNVGGEKVDHVVNGAMGLGPKIGAFYSNLNGDFNPTTMDLWFSRNMNRMAGNMFGFSDKATRQDRMEKGGVVKSHLNELRDVLSSGAVSNVSKARAKAMSKEMAALEAVPEGQLDRATAQQLAPEVYSWARDQHKTYQKSTGYTRSYHPDLKTPENAIGKKLDEGVTQLSDAPRTSSEREHWRNIVTQADKTLKDAGVKLTNADKQALWWFTEKDLFKQGGSPSRGKADYLDAAYRLIRKVKSGELPGGQQELLAAA